MTIIVPSNYVVPNTSYQTQDYSSGKPIAAIKVTPKQLNNDSFESKNQRAKKNSTFNKVLTGICLAAGAVFAGLALHKEWKIQKAKVLFQDLFLDKNITRKQTVEKLKDYGKILETKDDATFFKDLLIKIKNDFNLSKTKVEIASKDMSTFSEFNSKKNIITLKNNLERKDIVTNLFKQFRQAKVFENSKNLENSAKILADNEQTSTTFAQMMKEVLANNPCKEKNSSSFWSTDDIDLTLLGGLDIAEGLIHAAS